MMAQSPIGDGMFARLRYTPMRDVIRLRITGRLNIRRVVEQANLPQPLAALVLHVVRRTRLSRLDRSDVAEELITHFADGLDSGRTAEQLLRDFGDADRAATLIRRAKRRNHNAIQRLPRYSAYGLGLLALLYLIIAVRFFSGSPSPSRDFLAELNRFAAAAPQEQSGWPLYRSALILLEEPPKFDVRSLHDMPSRPGMNEWETMQAYLLRNEEALSLAVRAAARPHLGFVTGPTISEADAKLWPDRAENEAADDSLMSVRLPHLMEMRRLARLLAADAHRAAADGDEATVLANIGAALSMSEHLRELPILINELVAIAVFNLALNTTLSLLHDQPELFSEQSLRDLAHRIAGAHGGGAIQIDIAGERMWFYDMVQRVYTDDGRGGGRITAEGMRWLVSLQQHATLSETPESPWYNKAAMPAATLVMANRRDIVAKFDDLMNLAEAEGRQPLWLRSGTVDDILSDMQTSPIQYTRYWPVVLLTPAVSKATTNGERATIQRDATLIAIALELHRRRHGDWPASLDELVPHLLPTVPLDRYDGQPLRYLVRDGSPVLYSIGMNRTDNGGQLHEQLDRVTRRMDGDWILWPPER